MGNDRSFRRGRKYTNGEITVYWKPDSCIHASHCYRELIEVFDPGKRPWVDLYGSTTGRIIEVVDMCPTDALTWKFNEDERNRDIDPEHTNHVSFRRPELNNPANEISEDPVSVKIMPNGPIVLNGTFTLNYGTTKKEVKESILSLCRCGVSNHMPFCDGNHRKVGFNDN